MSLDHFNHDFDGGAPDIPYGVGDRYYAQDWARDFWFLYNAPGYMMKHYYNSFPVLLQDSYIVKGTGWNQIDIPIAAGIVEYEVDVPNSFAAIPPTVKQEDTVLLVESTAQTDYTMSSATLDGVTVNYVKLTYAEANIASRTRAKKAGSYQYERGRSFAFVVDSVAPTNKDVVLAEIVGDGATFLTIDRYTRTPEINNPFDYIVRSQTDWNQIITRVAANQYKIIDGITNIYVKILAGGYQCQGASSYLEGGDTWGYIETNNCQKIVFEEGAFLDFHQSRGYIEFNTDYGFYQGIDLQGDKGASAATVRSFYINAEYCIFLNLRTSLRLSSAIMKCFEMNAAIVEETNKLYGCVVNDIDSSLDIYGFYGCYNLTSCIVENMESTGDKCYGFSECLGVKGCNAIGLDVSGGIDTVIGFNNCYLISDCKAEDIDSSVNGSYGFSGCKKISSCYAYDIASSAGIVYGFDSCYQISACEVKQLDHTGAIGAINTIGYYNCVEVSGCRTEDIDSNSSGTAVAFGLCVSVSACYAYDIDSSGGNAYGFDSCSQISACYANKIDHSGAVGGMNAHGFRSCNQISACYANDIDTNGGGGIANGFNSCNYGSSLSTTEVANAGNDYIDTTDAAIANKFSCHPTNWT